MAGVEPSPSLIALANTVALQTVRFIKTSSEFVGIRAGDTLDKISFTQQAGGGRSPDAPDQIRVALALECSLLNSSDPGRIVARTSCELSLDYLVRNTELLEGLSDQDMLQFALTTGRYNAWPYMREFCHTASLRMGLPVPIMLPTLPPIAQHQVPAQAETQPAQSNQG